MLGGIAGVVGTAAMTETMRLMFTHLPATERYPLPPREITEIIATSQAKASETVARTGTIAAHFAYGAAAGLIYGSLLRPAAVRSGAAYGVAVWAVSYLGWLPAARILKPAVEHPFRRNLLMIAAHLVWGGVTAATLRSLDLAQTSVFSGGANKDAAPPTGAPPP